MLYMNELISIIVPVYKVQKYLDKCVESIVNQTYKNLEIILVDDGSPDNCPELCDKWAEKDRRIIVIHQPNMGGGAARNTALDAATGSLIGFVDSDDYIAENMYEYLYELLSQGADIAECDYKKVSDNNELFDNIESKFSFYSPQEAMKAHIQDNIFRQVIWNKLYKKSVIRDVRFPVESKIDDEFFTYKVLGNAKKLIHSDKICYAYRQQNDSIMHSVTAAHGLQAIKAKELRYDYICTHFPELKQLSLINLWFTCIYIGQKALYESEKVNRNNTLKNLNKILTEHPISLSSDMGKNAVWLFIAKHSLKTVCLLRNLLRIGL